MKNFTSWLQRELTNLCVVGWGTMLQNRKVAGSSPDEVDYFN
jgi:hypothetical protein